MAAFEVSESADTRQELQAKPLATTVGQAQPRLSTEVVQVVKAEKRLPHGASHGSCRRWRLKSNP